MHILSVDLYIIIHLYATHTGLRVIMVVARTGVVVSTLSSINEVNQRWARLVLRWVTVSGFSSRCRTIIPVCGQSPSSTQPGHPFVGRRNEYQPKDVDALRLGSKSRYGSCVGDG